MRDGFETLRRFLLLLLLAGMIVTGVELWLLEHTEDWEQWIPFVGLGAGFVLGLIVLVRPRRANVRLFQAVMMMCIALGGLGLYFHYRGNVEFELEMVPALEGWELFRKSMGGATPSLAPLAMAQFGLLGLACTYRHARLARAKRSTDQEEDA
ncbi:MAG: hypothetical protein L0271_22015 [Gemmatimonadetes bacterium]|nr:hypothetical protein [Gemmatimonadota bacterium]